MLTPEQEEVIRHGSELWQLDHEALSLRCFHAERQLAALVAIAEAAERLGEFNWFTTEKASMAAISTLYGLLAAWRAAGGGMTDGE